MTARSDEQLAPKPKTETDHDLLIRLDTKFDILINRMERFETDKAEIWVAIDGIRETLNRGRGMLSSAQMLWAVAAATPGAASLLYMLTQD